MTIAGTTDLLEKSRTPRRGGIAREAGARDDRAGPNPASETRMLNRARDSAKIHHS